MQFSNIPKHVGFIMDGNGRWAKLKGLPRAKGHQAGLKRVDDVLQLCQKYGVQYVSLYVFSTENWSRPQSEVDHLFDLAREYLKKSKNFLKKDIKVLVSGERDRLPKDLVDSMEKIQQETKDCKSLVLNLCINYGGRTEMVYAINKILSSGKEVDEKSIAACLYNPELPDLVLVVRTSGEMRLSNFMLFQAAYAELYFTNAHWPDFDESEFVKMLSSFNKRERKFGDIKN